MWKYLPNVVVWERLLLSGKSQRERREESRVEWRENRTERKIESRVGRKQIYTSQPRALKKNNKKTYVLMSCARK